MTPEKFFPAQGQTRETLWPPTASLVGMGKKRKPSVVPRGGSPKRTRRRRTHRRWNGLNRLTHAWPTETGGEVFSLGEYISQKKKKRKGQEWMERLEEKKTTPKTNPSRQDRTRTPPEGGGRAVTLATLWRGEGAVRGQQNFPRKGKKGCGQHHQLKGPRKKGVAAEKGHGRAERDSLPEEPGLGRTEAHTGATGGCVMGGKTQWLMHKTCRAEREPQRRRHNRQRWVGEFG